MVKRCNFDDAIAFYQHQDELDVMDQSMLNALTYLNSQNLHGRAMPEYGRIELKFSHGDCPVTMNIEFDSLRETGTASIILPMNCIKEKRAVLGELLHRINCITVLGEWDLDPDDGECVVKYTHFIGDTPLSVHQAERMIDIPLMEEHQYENTIIPLMMGRKPDPDQACAEYKEMTTCEEGENGFRRMLLDALRAKRKQTDEIIVEDTPGNGTETS